MQGSTNREQKTSYDLAARGHRTQQCLALRLDVCEAACHLPAPRLSGIHEWAIKHWHAAAGWKACPRRLREPAKRTPPLSRVIQGGGEILPGPENSIDQSRL